MEQPMSEQGSDPVVNYPMATGGSPILAADPSLVRWLQEPRDVVNEIRIRLKGYDYDEEKRSFILKYKPLLNDDGVNEVATMIRGHLNKTVQLSNFSEQEVARMAKEATLAIAQCLYQNWARFGIHDDVILDKLQKGIDEEVVSNITLTYVENGIVYAVNDKRILRKMYPKPDISSFREILLLVDHLVFASLNKAKSGGERLFLTKTISETVSKVQTESPRRDKKKSFWSKLRL